MILLYRNSCRSTPCLEVARLPSSTPLPWIPGVVETGICLQSKAVKAKLGRMMTNWARLVKNEVHSLIHWEQQRQAMLSSCFITALGQQSRIFSSPSDVWQKACFCLNFFLSTVQNHSVLNQIPVWVVLFLSNLQMRGFGLVSCNSCCSETALGKYKAPSQDIICFIPEGFLAQCRFFVVRNGKIAVQVTECSVIWMVHGNGTLYNFCAQHTLLFSTMTCKKRFLG